MEELIAMPSTFPASSALQPLEKKNYGTLWHIACYSYANGQPPERYVCSGCDEHNNNKNISGSKQKNRKKKMRHERHWFQDCPYREEWKDSKRNGGTNNTQKMEQQPKRQQPKEQITCEDIEPFRWYL